MAQAFLFYNPLAGGGAVLEDLSLLEFILDEPCIACDLTRPETYESALFSLKPEDYIVLCGGDGTLHSFVNLTKELELPNPVFCFPVGCSNDFAADFGKPFEANPFPVTQALKELPEITVKKRCMLFLTGVSFGVPVGTIRRTSFGKRGYTQPRNLSVTVRSGGRESRYDRVGMLFVLYGRHCAGGLTPIPGKERGTLSVLLCHRCGKHRKGRLLRKLRRGQEITGERGVSVLSGDDFYIAWNHPVPLWVDGEALESVTAFRVKNRKDMQ